jgi:hypothetical protein
LHLSFVAPASRRLFWGVNVSSRTAPCANARMLLSAHALSPKKSAIPADKLALYEALIKSVPQIERKGAVHPYTSLNGHMFTYLDQTGTLGLRLPPDALAAFLKKYKTTLFRSYGVVKKDWATVPASLLENTKELKKHLEVSYEYVKTLKPK